MTRRRKPKGEGRKGPTGVPRGSNTTKGCQGAQIATRGDVAGRAEEMAALAKATEKHKLEVADARKVQYRKSNAKKRKGPDDESAHSPAASPCPSPPAAAATQKDSPEPVDPRSDKGRQYLSRYARRLEQSLPYGNRRTEQVVRKFIERQGGAHAAAAADTAAAAALGWRLRDAASEELHHEDKNALFTAIAVGGEGRGTERCTVNFMLGRPLDKQLSGAVKRRTAQGRARRKKPVGDAYRSWARGPGRKPRSDSYWKGENGEKIHQVLGTAGVRVPQH